MEEKPTDRYRPGKMSGPVNITVCDLDRAFALSGIVGIRGFLIQQARELCWSRPMARFRSPLGRNKLPEPEPFTFDVDAIARLLHSTPKVIRRSIYSLVDMRIFTPAGDEGMVINKHYREWMDARGRPLLNATQITYVEAAKSYGEGGKSCVGIPLEQWKMLMAEMDSQEATSAESDRHNSTRNAPIQERNAPIPTRNAPIQERNAIVPGAIEERPPASAGAPRTRGI